MPNFIAQTEAQITSDLATYGYVHTETTNGITPLVMYFTDSLGSILKLSVDTSIPLSTAMVYTNNVTNCHREQVAVLASSVVTDLASLDALLIAVYPVVDPMVIKVEELASVEEREVLVPTGTTYYTVTEFTDDDLIVYNVGGVQSPYRDRTLSWVPVTLVGPSWFLNNDLTVQVNTADVFNIALGNYIVVKP